MNEHPYSGIIAHYERCLEVYSEGARAVDWKSDHDAATRYDVMLDLIKGDTQPVTLLDFGCGLGGLRDHLLAKNLNYIAYSGLEISSHFAEAARIRQPSVNIYCQDVLTSRDILPEFDYVIMNGIFTRRQNLNYSEMLSYMKKLILKVYSISKYGLAFNTMSQYVDWEHESLFHLLISDAVQFISEELSKNFIVRNDYGLYETAFYVYRDLDKVGP